MNTLRFFNFIFLIILMILQGLILNGCTLTVPKGVTRHIVMVNGRGNAVNAAGEEQCESNGTCVGVHNKFIRSFIDYEQVTSAEYQAHLEDMMTHLRVFPKHPTSNGPKRKVLLYIHGGLNTQTGTIERAKKLADPIGKAGYFPIFINWQSSLFSSYRDHLLYVRQGQWKEWGPILSPFYLAWDFLRGVARAPLTWFFMFKNDLESVVDFESTQHAEAAFEEVRRRYRESLATPSGQHTDAIAISRSSDIRTDFEKGISGLQYFVTIPTKLLLTPIIDAMGTSSWDIMLRRTDTLFHKEGEFEQDAVKLDDPVTGNGGLSIFFRRLKKEIQNNPQEWEITLVGHSMGTIVINEILRQFHDIHFQNIVFMGAASTIHDYETGMFPYLNNPEHQKTQLYHVVLHEEAEVREHWDEFTKIVDFPPRGSLLVWIDNFLSKPVTPLDRTVGRWSNLVVSLRDTPRNLRDRIHVKAFGVGKALRCKEPQKHSELAQFPFCELPQFTFWEESYWKPSQHP